MAKRKYDFQAVPFEMVPPDVKASWNIYDGKFAPAYLLTKSPQFGNVYLTSQKIYEFRREHGYDPREISNDYARSLLRKVRVKRGEVIVNMLEMEANEEDLWE